MNLKSDSFWWKWYMESKLIIDKFFHDSTSKSFEWKVDERVHYTKSVDLCQYVRVTCIYAPLIVTFHIGSAAFLLASILMLPGTMYGLVGYWFLLAVLLRVAFGIAGVALIAWLAHKWYENRKAKKNNETDPAPEGIVKLAYRSWKERFCAIIKVEE